MCSVLGYSGGFNPEVVVDLCKWSRVRGLHSFGFAHRKEGEIKVEKFFDYDKFVYNLLQESPEEFIAHFRYSTSGDYHDMRNNQPLFKDGVAMAFNGVLDMRTKEKMEEAYGVELETENDGELFYSFGELEFVNFLRQNFECTFAGVFLKEGGGITALRNDYRPLHKYTSKKGDLKVFASTRDILERSHLTSSVELIEPYIYHHA